MEDLRPDAVPGGSGSAMEEIVGESINRGLLGAPAEISIAAIETGGEGESSRHKLSLGAKFAIGWMVFVILFAIFAKLGIITWGDPNESFTRCARRGPFSKEGSVSGFLAGCDSNGRNMMARLALGAWTSLYVAIGAIILGFTIGGTLGVIAGYFGGKVDTFLTGLFNIFLSIPGVVLTLALVAFLQGSAEQAQDAFLSPELILIIAIGVVSIPLVGRIARASALSWTQREFVLAARSQGAKHRRVIIKEVLPNVLPAIFSISLLGVAIAIVVEGTLAILGVGIKPPTPSWGNIIATDRGNLFTSPHIVFEASMMIFFTVLSLNMLGDVIRSRFDVREGVL